MPGMKGAASIVMGDRVDGVSGTSTRGGSGVLCSKICRQRCWMGEQPSRLHCRPQAAGSTVWPTAYLGTGTAELV